MSQVSGETVGSESAKLVSDKQRIIEDMLLWDPRTQAACRQILQQAVLQSSTGLISFVSSVIHNEHMKRCWHPCLFKIQ